MTDGSGKDTEKRLAALEAGLRDALAILARIEAKVDRSLGIFDAIGSIAAGIPPRLVAALHDMTPAEHVALQMVLDNRSNHEISVCLDVSEDRVRAWVESLSGKLGVKARSEVRDLMRPVMARMPADEYERASGGIPKDWNNRYGVGGIRDPYRGIYHPDGQKPAG
ncbi:LuxR C-terminal-related transcriptional regulator [Tropicimonas sp.]|uniref:LuxR C-terminal-related transcriptional regulator n=1 Tax=Tropicimonas sp. TaxID=2067044 RepID=UPI003A839AC1